MAIGKNFNLYLMDGEATGRIKCTLSNWTGIAYKIPRSYLDACKNRIDLKRSGVYFLFGHNEKNEEEVYIGQASKRKMGEGVLFRVQEHLKDPTCFSDVVIFTTQNDSFGPTEISYLENRFTNLAIASARMHVRNGNDPNPGNVTEEKESELEEFIQYAKIILGIFGYRIFEPRHKLPDETPTTQPKAEEEETMFFSLVRKIKSSGKTIKAQCQRTKKGFLVLKGSMFETNSKEYIPDSIDELRKKAMQNNEIVNGILTKEYLFTSPSAAACFVTGTSISGPDAWTTAEGVKLKDLDGKND